MSRSEEIRARLDHPLIDSDGHTVEFLPAFRDYLKNVVGAEMADRYCFGDPKSSPVARWYSLSPAERETRRITRPAWWAVPTKNTLDRATAALPKLLYKRLDEFGLDFSIVYPTYGIGMVHIADDEMRRATCRALNTMHADIFREYADRLTPVAVIPAHTPAEAKEELDYAIGQLGLKAILMPSYVLRPRADGKGHWYDTLCLNSAYDYDSVWAKCLEWKVTPTFHSPSSGLGSRTSTTNFTYNHIGHFAASGEALCKAAFMGGVTRRFPELRMAFLEGGVGWACNLYCDLVGHWKKRNRTGIENYDPKNLDQSLYMELHRRYGGRLVEGRLEDKRSMQLAMFGRDFTMFGDDSILGAAREDPETLDDFARCGIQRPEEICELFVPKFGFGCEADDPVNAWAFDAGRNPYGAKLNAIFSSDIGHWDVVDMGDVAAEAYELVEDGLITEGDFRDFVFANPVKMWTHMNPEFFKGTVIESSVELKPA